VVSDMFVQLIEHTHTHTLSLSLALTHIYTLYIHYLTHTRSHTQVSFAKEAVHQEGSFALEI